MADLFTSLGFRAKPATETESPNGAVDGNEIPPDPTFDDDDAPVKHPCEQCGRDVQYKGRGRVPKLCPDCKLAGTDRSGSESVRPVRQAGRGMDKRKAKVAGNLQEIAGMIGGGIHMAAPVTGTTIVMTSPPAIDSLVEIASKYPRMMDGLEKITEVMPWANIARFAGAVMFALMVDAGRLQPYGLVAETLGVAEAAQAAHYVAPPEEDEYQQVPYPMGTGPREETERPVPSPRRFVMPDGV